MKYLVLTLGILAVSLTGFIPQPAIIFNGKPAGTGLGIDRAEAYVYGQGRRVARRTARRTARRVSRRHNYYRPVAPVAPVVVGGAVAATAAAVAVGTRVATLPPACTSVHVNGITYYNCNGTYYQPVYDGPNVVYVVVQNPGY